MLAHLSFITVDPIIMAGADYRPVRLQLAGYLIADKESDRRRWHPIIKDIPRSHTANHNLFLILFADTQHH
jgi:hypothetical protein